jgi:ParB-like chromosome segregation protein Spo0J
MSRPRVRLQPTATSLVKPVAACSRRYQMNYRAPSELNPSPIKLRKASKRQIEHLVECLRRWGVVIPVLIDATDQIIAGHGIWEAAKELALEVIPTVTLDHLSHAEARALRIAINKIQELSTWNESVLKDELTFLAEFDFETLSYTCFSSAELDPILHGPANKPDDALLSLATTAISRLGDIWVFEGGHRLGCFDALDAGSYAAVMAGSLAFGFKVM